MKTFTLEEAQSLLPVLESLLKRAIEGKQSAEQVEPGLSELARRIYLSGGMKVDVASVAKQRAEIEAHLQRVRESIAEIDSIGVQVKDLEAGLLDFPCRLDDQVVLLCWRMGESAIEYWHTVEHGFQRPSARGRALSPPFRLRRKAQLSRLKRRPYPSTRVTAHSHLGSIRSRPSYLSESLSVRVSILKPGSCFFTSNPAAADRS